jgi:hypothetical protein
MFAGGIDFTVNMDTIQVSFTAFFIPGKFKVA